VSDDELLMRYVVGKDDVEAMRAAGAPREYPSGRKPLLALLENLTRRADCRHICIRKDGLSVILGTRADVVAVADNQQDEPDPAHSQKAIAKNSRAPS
jgi:hypothetical protein